MNYPAIPREFFNGDCFDAYRILGAHPCTAPDGAEGWRFAVWAPGATAVEVCGGFDGWEAGVPMEKADTGVWSAFIPGLAEGDLYKYRVHGADGNANQIGNGHPRNHARDGGGDFSWTGQLRQDNRAHAEKCAMREAGNQPAHRQHKIRGREGEDGVANHAQGDQKQQNMFERKAIGKERNNGRAKHYAKGVK